MRHHARARGGLAPVAGLAGRQLPARCDRVACVASTATPKTIDARPAGPPPPMRDVASMRVLHSRTCSPPAAAGSASDMEAAVCSGVPHERAPRNWG